MDNIREVAAPVYKVLNLLIFNEGELSKTNQTPRHHKSYLRLTASRLMLKLCASSSALNDLLAAKAFVNLACVAQDRMFAVRHGFISKLKKYLTHNRLGSRFFPIAFIVAFEPDDSFREETKIWIKSRAKFYRDNSKTTLEAVLPRFMSMLAHHPDFGVDEIDLLETAQYLLFYISSVATEDNIGMLYKYAERVKQTRDAISPEDSDNLYVLSDLTQAVIRKWQEKKGWNMQSYPAKTGLSKDLFAALPSHDAAQEIAEKSYLPEDMEEALDGLLKTSDKRKVRIN
jgi:sister-chromatid-cohesion protein PDS5